MKEISYEDETYEGDCWEHEIPWDLNREGHDITLVMDFIK
jgi:hypothetical protein